MLKRDIARIGLQPVIFLLEVLDSSIEVIQVLIPEQLVVDNIPLPACVLERVAVTLAGEVKPLEE